MIRKAAQPSGQSGLVQALTREFRLGLNRLERGVIVLGLATGECRAIEVGSD